MNIRAQFPPEKIDSAFVWNGADWQRAPSIWLHSLDAREVEELTAGAKRFLDRGGLLADLTRDDIPLSSLQNRIEALKQCLLKGPGARVLRGLDREALSPAEAAVAFYALGMHLGSPRSQNAAGDLLGHVRDVGARASNTQTRIYQTSERQTFHTDSADVVGLFCLQEAKAGGDSLLVSTVTIYNHMMRRRPDLARLLFDPIATDRRGEVPEGEKPYFEIPVFNWFAGELTGVYQRQYIDSAQRFEGAMRLTEQHIAALDLFDELANDPELHFCMRLQPGDMQFVYNHALLHDRTGFVDFEQPEKKRHLYRLWLAMDDDRELPPCFAQRFGQTTVGDRGGILVK
ncbi:MAG: TauD/TfdA family dioxygenase [Granulosicoccaceae bacterium]